MLEKYNNKNVTCDTAYIDSKPIDRSSNIVTPFDSCLPVVSSILKESFFWRTSCSDQAVHIVPFDTIVKERMEENQPVRNLCIRTFCLNFPIVF